MGEAPPPPPKDLPHSQINKLQSGNWSIHDDLQFRSRNLSKLKPCLQANLSDQLDATRPVTHMPVGMALSEPHATSETLRKKYSSGNGIRSLGRFLRGWNKHYDHQSPRPPRPPPNTTPIISGAAFLKTTASSPTASTASSNGDVAVHPMAVVVQRYSILNDVAPGNETQLDICGITGNNITTDKSASAMYHLSDRVGNNTKDPKMDTVSISSEPTFSLQTNCNHNDNEGGPITGDQSDGTDMTSESDSVAISTPPAQIMVEDYKTGNDHGNLVSDTARRIWEQDPTVYDDLEHIAEWIGNGKPMSLSILRRYFLFFDFTDVRLDEAFRTFCGKLHLKAETQQIDRVLEEFAKRYWDCNPSSIYGNSDVVHAIVYSLLLLNTDLHVAQGHHKKMSRSAFIRNTTNAVSFQCHQQMEGHSNDSIISEMDESRASSVVFDNEDHDLKRSSSYKSSSSTSGSSIIRLYPCELPSMTPMALKVGSKVWYAELEVILREMYISIRDHEILDPSLAAAASREKDNASHSVGNGRHHVRRLSLHVSPGTRAGGVLKRSVGTIMFKTGRESMVLNEEPTEEQLRSLEPTSQRQRSTSVQSCFSQGSSSLSHATTNYQDVASLLYHSELSSSYTSTAPYYKEGLLVRKHLLDRKGSKSRHREWKECFIVVDRGEIRMYRLDSSSFHDVEPHQQLQYRKAGIRASMMMTRAHQDMSTASSAAATVGGGDWLVWANAEPLGTIDLKHALSNTLPSGYSPQRPYAFALQQANGGVYVFQAGSSDQVAEWVSTCNYWAARESKEPLTGGVSSMEYGWGACLDEGNTTAAISTKTPIPPVYEWMPPAPSLGTSSLGEKEQLEALGRYIRKINDELDAHHDIKEKMEIRFSSCMRSSQAIRAMANWEKRSQYLLHEIIKYQNYHDSIEKSLALQDEAIQKMGS